MPNIQPNGVFHLPVKSNVPASGDYRIRFFDYDGTLLKTQWVYDSEDASAPPTPTHENLTFYGWNKSFTGVTKNLDVGAIYTSVHSYLYITLSSASGLVLTLNLNKSAATNTTVYWGDGTSAASSTIGNVSFAKTYSAEGSYVIRIESVAAYTLGWNNSTNRMFSAELNGVITKAIVGTSVNLSNYTFYRARSMTAISLGNSISSIPAYCFDACYKLTGITLPASCTTLGIYSYNGNVSLKCISLPETLTTIGINTFYFATSLQSIILPFSVTVITAYLFNQAYGLEEIQIQGNITQVSSNAFQSIGRVKSLWFPYSLTALYNESLSSLYSIEEFIFSSNTPPTLSATTVFNFNTLLQYNVRIYVPDAAVTAYKTATNWVTFANYIYPMSARP